MLTFPEIQVLKLFLSDKESLKNDIFLESGVFPGGHESCFWVFHGVSIGFF